MRLLNMTLLLVMMITILVCQGESLILDNNQFLIYNKKYHKSRLAQWGTKHKNVGSYQHGLNFDQLWTLEPHPRKQGCYYIVNEKYPKFRLADYRHKLIVYDGNHYDDQLFKFVPNGDGYYYIKSCRYTHDRIVKWGTEDRKTGIYDGPGQWEQLWRLVPRFKASFFTDVIFHFDNRQGSMPIVREISVTRGIKKTTTSSIKNKSTYKKSIGAAIGGAVKLIDIWMTSTTEFTHELEISFAHTNEQS